MEIGELTQQFLEKLVEDSLESKVSYELEGDTPLARFFRTLDEGTREGSELRALKDEAQKRAKEAVETDKELVDSEPDEE